MIRKASDWRVLYIDSNSETLRISDGNLGLFGGRGENYARLLEMYLLEDPDEDISTPFLWSSGPLVGTGLPGASRINLAAQSPVTGGIGSSSAGSDFACKMRLAGFDQVVITGSFPRPVYILLYEAKTFIRDARSLWGLTVSQTDAWLREREGDDISTAIIGPAGEREVMAACILFDARRAAGRCGLGINMAQKNLKAIVVKGEGRLQVARPALFSKVKDLLLERIKEDDMLCQIMKYGTLQEKMDGTEPVQNFRQGILLPENREKITASSFEPYLVERYGCMDCPIHCGSRYSIDRGRFSGKGTSGLHANSITDFGSRLGIYDPEAIIIAHGLCNDYGMDIDNTSGVIAWAMEAFEKGILTPQDMDGIELSWGNAEGVISLITKIAYREGIGNLLANGCKKAAVELGCESQNFCIEVKGQELMEPLRSYKGWALGVVVSERGGTHTRGAPILELSGEVPGKIAARAGLSSLSLPANSYEGKPEVVVYYERMHAILDSLGLCYLISDWEGPELPSFRELSEAILAVLGKEIQPEELKLLGERVHTFGKLFNMAYTKFSREDDYPPSRLMEDPIETGESLPREKWDIMLDHYYELHRWDPRTGIPTKDGLEELGLSRFSQILKVWDKVQDGFGK